MVAKRRLVNAAPKPSGTRFGHGFLIRLAVVGGATAFILLLTTVLSAGPLPSWTGLIAAIGGISLLLGVLAGLFDERFVDWWFRFVRAFFTHIP